MFPAVFQLQTQPTHPTNNTNIGHVINYQIFPQTFCSMAQQFEDSAFPNFNITFTSDPSYRQEDMKGYAFPTAHGHPRSHKTDSSNATSCEYDVTHAVFSVLHKESEALGNEMLQTNANVAHTSTTCLQEVQRQTCDYTSSAQNHNGSLRSRSPLNQLRLPNIKTSANVAANVMSEECDLGYYSFSDHSMFPDISDALNYSDGSNEMFDDVKSNFSDIIDDVLDSMDGHDIKYEPTASPACDSTENRRYDCVNEVSNTNEYKEHVGFNFINEPVNAQVFPSGTGSFTWFPNSHGMKTYIQPFKHDVRNGDAPFCEHCGKSFQTKSSLRVHMRQHRGDRPHKCPQCEKSFTQKSTLRTHLRTHTGERPYSCTFCARAFSDYSTYRKHVRIHTGERPYTCDVCNKSFTQSGNMLRHRDVHFKKSNK